MIITFILCITLLLMQERFFASEMAKFKVKDTAKLAKVLEDEIKSMREVKERMEVFLIKHGLGRS